MESLSPDKTSGRLRPMSSPLGFKAAKSNPSEIEIVSSSKRQDTLCRCMSQQAQLPWAVLLPWAALLPWPFLACHQSPAITTGDVWLAGSLQGMTLCLQG